MTPRKKAQYLVDAFNRSYRVGTSVTYLKSEIEGRQITTVEAPAYIQGDDTPMVCLSGVGVALIDKVEPYFGGNATAYTQQPQSRKKPSLFSLFKQGFNALIGGNLR